MFLIGQMVRFRNLDFDGCKLKLDGKVGQIKQTDFEGRKGVYLLSTKATATGQIRLLEKEMELIKGDGSGQQCDKCGSMNMLRTGTCVTCQNCGENSGCG